ncbi:carbon storage regulator [Lampropedia aestuarii]|uniref:Carbon storage regulator n=1 Tax=Lampropedia aestuarii TaxID=2562762 RepID=A0A4V3YWS2_9BURK|nr:carbon storage regulator [Lampropedia aestuarii]
MALTLDLRPGEALSIGDVVIHYEYKSGNAARLHIEAAPSVPVRKAAPDAQQKSAMAQAPTVPIMRK